MRNWYMWITYIAKHKDTACHAHTGLKIKVLAYLAAMGYFGA